VTKDDDDGAMRRQRVALADTLNGVVAALR
jgi:hypothetical protein